MTDITMKEENEIQGRDSKENVILMNGKNLLSMIQDEIDKPNKILKLINNSITKSTGPNEITLNDRIKHIPIKYCKDETNKSYENCEKKLPSAAIYKWDPILLWFKPSLCCLKEIGEMINKLNLVGISSIGCGTGLLEFLLEELIETKVTGYEVNKEWWDSKHSPVQFIEPIYTDSLQSIPIIEKDRAIFFCYFNNEYVFREYLSSYEGPLLVIIGSAEGGKSTRPSPLDFIEDKEWRIVKLHQTNNNDLMAFYIRRYL